MAANPGYVSSVKIGANLITLTQSADLDLVAKELDTTSIGGNGFETFIMGTLGGKLALKGNTDQSDTNGQQAVINAWINRTSLSGVVFSPDGTHTFTFTGGCWVTDVKLSDAATGGSTFDFSLRPNGTITAA